MYAVTVQQKYLMSVKMTDKAMIGRAEIDKAAFVLKTIAHPTRLTIIDFLSKQGRKTVSDICHSLELEQSLASHHLNTMKLKGVLGSVREGKNILYFLKLHEVTQVISCIDNCNLTFSV